MHRRLNITALGSAVAVVLALSGCKVVVNEDAEGSDAATGTSGTTTDHRQASARPALAERSEHVHAEPAQPSVAVEAPPPFTPYTLADGPDVCFRALADHLGADTKVMEVISFFSAGQQIDPNESKPAGEMTICTAEYQNPEDPRKLLRVTMDTRDGSFREPQPVEIRAHGNAADFRLEDYLIPLSQVDAAALTGVMTSLEPTLGVYGTYAWTGVRLSEPDTFREQHWLRLDLNGRLASNDLKGSGYASVTVDGKTLIRSYLQP